jgi:hypothetical protein
MFVADTINFWEIAMKDPLPLATIQNAVIDFIEMNLRERRGCRREPRGTEPHSSAPQPGIIDKIVAFVVPADTDIAITAYVHRNH